MSQVDAFIKLEGIKGESKDQKHKDEIEILNWSWGLNNTGSAHFGGGVGAGKVQVGDIHIVKRVDTSSPSLMKACSTGKHVPKALLTVRKSGGENNQLEYFKVELKDILVSSVSASSKEGSPWLTEELSLNFAEFKVVYTPQDEKGGGGAQVEFAYNIAQNKSV